MAQFVDFVGLNTFIYEFNGWYPPEQFSHAGVPKLETIEYPLGTGEGWPVTQNHFDTAYHSPAPSSIKIRGKNHHFPVALSEMTSYFSALLLYRNGPYGFPSWKQIRVSENPLTRKQNKNSIFTIVGPPKLITIGSQTQRREILSRHGDIRAFQEPPVTSRYHPVSFNVGNQVISRGKTFMRKFTAKSSLGNATEFFVNKELNDILGLPVGTESENYELITSYYLDGALDDLGSPIDSFNSLKYRETVFPKEINTYRAKVRGRQNFYFPWHSDRATRTEISASNIFGNLIRRQSKWPLDAQEGLFNNPELTLAAGLKNIGEPMIGYGSHATDNLDQWDTGNNEDAYNQDGFASGASGVLQNTYCRFADSINVRYGVHGRLWSYYDRTGDGSTEGVNYSTSDNHYDKLTSGPLYSRLHTCYRLGSVVHYAGMEIPETSSYAAMLRNRSYGQYPTSSVNGHSQYRYSLIGQAKWEAGDMAGYYSGSTWVSAPKQPFYDSYDEYAREIRVVGQGYSILPEFRASDYTFALEASGSDQANLKMFSLTGSSTSGQYRSVSDANEDVFFKTYSTTDFLKHFELIKEDHTDFVDPARITLKMKAIKKFLPYEGFYPVQRTLDIAKQFYDSYAENIYCHEAVKESDPVKYGRPQGFREPLDEKLEKATVNDLGIQPIIEPLFAPGILYNTIKSGVACDLPITLRERPLRIPAYTASADTDSRGSTFQVPDTQMTMNLRSGLLEGFNNPLTQGPDALNAGYNQFYRVPFQALLAPRSALANKVIYPQEVHSSGALDFYSIWDGNAKNNLYIKMIHNFLAEIPDFFLKDQKLTELVSLPQDHPNFGVVKQDLNSRRFPTLQFKIDTAMAAKDTIAIAFDVAASRQKYTIQAHGSTNSGFFSESTKVAYMSTGTYTNTTQQAIGIALLLKTIPFLANNFTIDGSSVASTVILTSKFFNEDYNLDFGFSATSGGSFDVTYTNYKGRKAIPKYGMRVKMYRTTDAKTNLISGQNVQEFGIPQDKFGSRELITMYSRPSAFGPDNCFHMDISNDGATDHPGYRAAVKLPVAELPWYASTSKSPANSTSYTDFYPTTVVFDGADGSGHLDILKFMNCAHKTRGSHYGTNYPYTPSYYTGEGWADIIFDPPDGTRKYEIHEIVSNSKVRYWRWCTSSVDSVHSAEMMHTNDYAMQLSASVSLFNVVTNDEVVSVDEQVQNIQQKFGAAMDEVTIDKMQPKEQSRSRWSIKSIFETPILNFQHVKAQDLQLTLYSNDTLASATIPRGMWHQYGRIPQDCGIYLSVEDIPESFQQEMSGAFNEYHIEFSDVTRKAHLKSLRELCGFSDQPQKMGVLAKEKKISEAVVAIPFTEGGGKKKFFSIPRRDIDDILSRNEKRKEGLGKSTTAMVNKMGKYVFPPSMNFLENKEIQPFAMYIFEFHHTLKEKDLQDIWQNLPPDIGITHDSAVASISHPLFSEELMGPGKILEKEIVKEPAQTQRRMTMSEAREAAQARQANGESNTIPMATLAQRIFDGEHPTISNMVDTTTTNVYTQVSITKGQTVDLASNLRWMVFKVKKKARKNYYDHVNGRQIATLAANTMLKEMSYNWPYDFFSLVELVKLDAEITFKDISKSEDGKTSVTKNLVGTAKRNIPGKFGKSTKTNPTKKKK